MRGATPRARDRSLSSCPACKRTVSWQDNSHRPFCSLTCRLVDLGVWLDEGYRISGPEGAPTDPRLSSE
ncbi:MAG: DNA gyrase inhibitor YacG [Candidatus Methylomirabilia bacterium]